MRIVRTARGASLRHGRHVVSEALAAPGPTHSVFDVLAAAVTLRAPLDGRLAMLGFAAGGMVAPLRALGFTGPIEAVDLSEDGLRVFETVRGDWCGQVDVSIEDAVPWLTRGRSRYDVVVDDLSVQVPGDVRKPLVSLQTLPSLARRALRPDGFVVANGLPCDGFAWPGIIDALAAGFPEKRVVTFKQFDNRIVVAAPMLDATRTYATRLRDALTSIGSRQAGRITVATPRPR